MNTDSNPVFNPKREIVKTDKTHSYGIFYIRMPLTKNRT